VANAAHSEDAALAAVLRYLSDMADLLEALGQNRHRVRAYRTAAAILEGDPAGLRTRLDHGTLDRLPGIGTELAAKITAVADNQAQPGVAELVSRIPEGLEVLTAVPGVDRKLAIYLAVCLHVDCLSQLRRLADSHMLRTIAWLSAEREATIRQALHG